MQGNVSSVVLDDGQSLCSWVLMESDDAGSVTIPLARSLDSSMIDIDAAGGQTTHPPQDASGIERRLLARSAGPEAPSGVDSDVAGAPLPEHLEIEGEVASPTPSGSSGMLAGHDKDHGLDQQHAAGGQNILERTFLSHADHVFDTLQLSATGSEASEDSGDARIMQGSDLANAIFRFLDAIAEPNQPPPPPAVAGEPVPYGGTSSVLLWLMAMGITSPSERLANYHQLMNRLKRLGFPVSTEEAPTYPEQVLLGSVPPSDP